MSDWDASDSDSPASNAAGAPSKAPVVAKPAKSKWADEDEDDNNNVASDWEDSEEEEKPKPAPTTTTTAAPPKKKMTMKEKIAEREAKRAAEQSDGIYDEEAVLNPREAAQRAKQKELESDLNNAKELFGAASVEDKDLEKLLTYDCRTKEDFQAFTSLLIDSVLKRQQKRPLYPFFVEHLARELALPLKDSEVRKAASALSTLANEKQKEARDAASGKKKKGASKPVLGSSKAVGKVDTSTYEESLDDFGNDDFM